MINKGCRSLYKYTVYAHTAAASKLKVMASEKREDRATITTNENKKNYRHWCSKSLSYDQEQELKKQTKKKKNLMKVVLKNKKSLRTVKSGMWTTCYSPCASKLPIGCLRCGFYIGRVVGASAYKGEYQGGLVFSIITKPPVTFPSLFHFPLGSPLSPSERVPYSLSLKKKKTSL